MLIGIDPLLNADILYTLRAMGHGDDLVIADANFPSETMAKRLIRMEGVDAPTMLGKVLSVLPVDDFVGMPLARIEVVDDPSAVPEVCADMQTVVDSATGGRLQIGNVERFAFYEQARNAFAVIATGERRLYGCVMIKKGVIRPDE